jgi:hypothetical protein
MHCDYPKRGWHLHAQVALLYHDFESTQDSRAKDGGIWIIHVDYIESYHFCVDLLAFCEGEWDCLFPKASIFLPPKPNNEIPGWF